MARKFLTPIDMVKNEVRNMLLHLLASAPGSPVEGQVYQNTTDHHPYYHNGTTFKDLTDALLLGGVSSANHLARANHTGTQLAATVSDFNTAVRTNRLDQMAVPTADFSAGGFKITSLGAPSTGTDAVNKTYADGLAGGGVAWKNSVRAATTVAGTLASSFANSSVIDGITLATGDRILIKDQAAGADNGIYTVNAAGAPTRATDSDTAGEIKQAAVWVEEGTVNADQAFVLTTNAPITLGTTALVFTQFSGLGQITAGAGMTKTGNVIDVIGSARITIAADAIDLASGVASPGTYKSVTVDTYGRVTAGTNPTDRYSALIGDASATTIAVTQATHGRAADRTLLVQILEESTGDVVFCDISIGSGGTVTFVFATAPTASQYRITIM